MNKREAFTVSIQYEHGDVHAARMQRMKGNDDNVVAKQPRMPIKGLKNPNFESGLKDTNNSLNPTMESLVPKGYHVNVSSYARRTKLRLNEALKSVKTNVTSFGESTPYITSTGWTLVEQTNVPSSDTPFVKYVDINMAFSVVEYYARNNWAKHGLKRNMMNTKGFFFFNFDTRVGLEARLEGVFEEDGFSLIASYIDKPIVLDSYTNSMCHDSWGRSSFVRCLIEVNSEADLLDHVTIGIPSLVGDGFIKENIRVEYE
ncbi:hypothetical protein Tco_1350814 [Tanacetum coccineum]